MSTSTATAADPAVIAGHHPSPQPFDRRPRRSGHPPGRGRTRRQRRYLVDTGTDAGRSPSDKFLEDTPAIHDSINWGKVNQPISPAHFDGRRGRRPVVGSRRRRRSSASTATPAPTRSTASRSRWSRRGVARALREDALHQRPTGEQADLRAGLDDHQRRADSSSMIPEHVRPDGPIGIVQSLERAQGHDRRHALRGRDQEVRSSTR